MAAGKWQNYAMQHNEALGELFNRSIKQTLRAGLTTLLDNTKMDSGRAAAHWIIIPNKGPVRPGGWAQSRFPNPDYGEDPVGFAGDKKGHDPQVARHVMEREQRRSIDATVVGRRPATRFTFRNTVPASFDEGMGGKTPQNYHENAKLVDAIEAASSEMKVRFSQLIARGNVRKRPLG